MACRGFFECLLKLLNFLLTLAGLAMVGYGIYLFVEYTRTEANATLFSPVSGDETLVHLSRPMLMAVSLSSSIFDKLPKAWYDCCLLISAKIQLVCFVVARLIVFYFILEKLCGIVFQKIVMLIVSNCLCCITFAC